MAEPQTVNTGLIIPNTGDLPGLWGSNALNPDLVALDGYFGGVQTLSVSNVPVTLTAPAGFTATPSGGPTQAQNAVLRFTGAMSANVSVTLPLPGYYVIENLTTGTQVLQFRAAGVGQVICVDQGEIQHIYNDGTNVRFVNLGRTGHIEIWAGLSAMPAWVTNCTVPPFLLCDGTVYNFSTYPYLGARLGSSFGGNGSTTFGVPDLRGRMALPYDGTGTRITTAVSGINGQTLGASADNQGITLVSNQIPTITSNQNGIVTTSHPNGGGFTPTTAGTVSSFGAGGGGAASPVTSSGAWGQTNSFNSDAFNVNVTSNNTGGQSHSNVQPAQVTGIAVIKAA